MPQPSHSANDAYARSLGYPNAATMLAWRQRQLERTDPNYANALNQSMTPSWLSQIAPWHPMVTLQRVIDAWPK
jgi:hypothetical protein